MKKTSHRPSKTTQWQISTTVKIPVSGILEHVTVKPNRTTITRTTLDGQSATVILGNKEGTEIIVTPDDTVFTCTFGSSGHLSTIPEEFIGKEVTIIYKQ
jgi:putative transposon-encoded protein